MDGFIDDEELIELVKKSPQLYQKSHKLYKDARSKENAWKIIANSLNESTTNCERRYGSLRNRYATIKRKIKKLKPGEDGADLGRMWPLYSAMTFLDPYIAPRRVYKPVDNENSTKSILEVDAKTVYHETLTVDMDQMDEDQDPLSSTEAYFVSPTGSSASSMYSAPLSSQISQQAAAHKQEATGLLKTVTVKKREASTNENSYVIKSAPNSNRADETPEEDVEKAFGNTITAVLKGIKCRRTRRNCMVKLLQTALSYDTKTDSD